jgi:hypothetical protein
VRHRALAAEVGHRHNRPTFARFHQRLGELAARDERVRADVERHPEPVARRIREAALQILRCRIRHRVHQQIEPTVERLPHLREDALEVGVGTHVALGHERARNRLGEVSHALLDPLALIGEREARALVAEALGDRPGDRALVGHPHDEGGLAVEPSGGRHGGRL